MPPVALFRGIVDGAAIPLTLVRLSVLSLRQIVPAGKELLSAMFFIFG
jgi:hypothetical protein